MYRFRIHEIANSSTTTTAIAIHVPTGTRDQVRERVPDPADERHEPGDRAAEPGLPAARQRPVVGERLREPHADARPDRRRDPDQERVPALPRRERRREERRERRDRPVHEAREPRPARPCSTKSCLAVLASCCARRAAGGSDGTRPRSPRGDAPRPRGHEQLPELRVLGLRRRPRVEPRRLELHERDPAPDLLDAGRGTTRAGPGGRSLSRPAAARAGSPRRTSRGRPRIRRCRCESSSPHGVEGRRGFREVGSQDPARNSWKNPRVLLLERDREREHLAGREILEPPLHRATLPVTARERSITARRASRRPGRAERHRPHDALEVAGLDPLSRHRLADPLGEREGGGLEEVDVAEDPDLAEARASTAAK